MRRYYFVLLLFILTGLNVNAQNLITNPGFEDGLSTWNTGSWGGGAASFSTSTDEKQEGQKSAKIEVTTSAEDGGKVYLRKHGLQIEKDVPHTLEFHLMSKSGNTENISLSLYSHTNIGSAAWGYAYTNNNVPFQGDGKWHKIKIDFTPTVMAGNPDFNVLGLMFGFAKNTGTFYIDSISLVSDAELVTKDYHVSVYGNDDAEGTLEAPFRTISKAASLASAGDTIFIHKGTYNETIVPTRSGLPGFPIVYTSFNAERVIITAMEPLDNWQADGNGIYKTSVNWTLGQKNFVMNEQTALDLARWPNNTDGNVYTPDSKRNTGGSNGDVEFNAYLTHSEIPNYDWSKGGSIWFYGDRPGSGWTAWKAMIKSSSTGKVTFDLDKNPTWIRTYHPPGDKGDYFLEGIKEALDYDNEWFLDEAAKTLYVKLPGGKMPENGKVQMRKRELCVDLKGKSNIEIRNLALFGGSIEIDGSDNKIYGITSLYGNINRGVVTGFRADAQSILIKNGNNNSIERSEIGFGSGGGILDLASATKIIDCYIHDFNYLGFYNAPINARGSETVIKNNTITRGGRDALQITAKNSEVAFNDFSYSNLIADDCGLLYTLGAGKFMKIHHNWFHDAESRGSLYKAAGIYLDNDAGDFEVYNNVVWNTEWTNIQINWNGTNLDIYNNTLWNGSAVMGAWHKEGTKFTNVKVWNNLSDDSNWETQADKKNNISTGINPFTNSDAGDFTLKAGSQPIDKGIVIPGYTDGFVGSAPDVGAYEFGGDNWKPGISWDSQLGPNGTGCYGLPGENCIVTSAKKNEIFSNEINIFPNPVSDGFLQVELGKTTPELSWKVFDLNGVLVSNGSEKFTQKFDVKTNHLQSGFYFLRIETQEKQFTQKFIKQ